MNSGYTENQILFSKRKFVQNVIFKPCLLYFTIKEASLFLFRKSVIPICKPIVQLSPRQVMRKSICKEDMINFVSLIYDIFSGTNMYNSWSGIAPDQKISEEGLLLS